MIDNEALGLIVPSIDLPESPHYWIDHVKAFFMNADDNKQCALNSLREDVGKKYEETQNYENWMFNLHQIYLGLFSRFHAEIDEETLFKMQEYYDYEYKKLKIEIESNPFLVQDWQQYYKSRILQIAQRIYNNLTSTNFPNFPPTLVPSKDKFLKNITKKQKIIVKCLK
ncbi:7076_t:CDS:1 [Dentiscutata erythropus]|uniref:7076_t:CDS:1 n=1 Tax=Dentiscutata erythropus TaxID=1348616 RepID=A0A9N9I7Y1_9GLOM|nr:7076_t:CDS:1 [Dentiscutata erythropus]